MGAAVAAVLAAVVLALVHTPPVRKSVLSWAVRTLELRTGLVLAADDLSYNLLTGSVSLGNVRLRASRDAEPLLTAARVGVNLPLAVYLGTISFDDIVVEDARIAILTAADGTSNLPVAAADAQGQRPDDETAALSLPIRALHLRNVDLVYDDRTVPLHVAASGIDAALEHRAVRVFDGGTGPFAIRGGVDLSFGERTVRIEPIESRLAFDGSTVSMQDLPLDTRMGALSVSGRITDLLGAPVFELTYDGEVDVAEAARLASPPVPVRGSTRVSGSVTGPVSAIETAVRFDAADLTVGAEERLQASGEVLIDADRVSVNRLIASPHSGGQINAALEIPLEDRPLTAEASWEGLDMRVLFRAADVEPQPVGARLAGRAQFRAGPETTLAAQARVDAIREPGVTPLDGRVSARIAGGRWTLEHTLASGGLSAVGTASGSFNEVEPSSSTLGGGTRVTIASLASADASLAPFGIRVPEVLRQVGGALENTVGLSGTLGSPHASIDTAAPALDLPGVGLTSLAATIEADAARVSVPAVRLARESAELTGTVDLDLESNELQGALQASIGHLSDLEASVPEGTRVSGSLDADATLSGAIDSPVVEATITSPALEFAGDTYTDLRGSLRFADETVTVSSLTLNKDDGSLDVKGRYGLDGSYAVDLAVTNLAWSRTIAGDVDSRVVVNGAFSGAGTVEEPVGEGRLQFAITGGVAGDLIGDGQVEVVLAGDHGRIRANAPKLGAFASGIIGLSAPYDYRGSAVVSQLDLAGVAPLLGALPQQLTGRLSLTAASLGAAGSDRPPRVEINLQELAASLAGIPVTLAAPAVATWQPGEVTVRDLTATVGSGTLTAHGEWASRENTVVGGRFQGELADLVQAARAFGVETDVNASGQLMAEAFATANRGDLIASVALESGTIGFDGATLENVRLEAGVTGEAFTVHAMSGHLDAERASGDFTATGSATLPDMNPRAANGRFVIESASFDAAGVDVTQVRPSVLTVRNGVVSLDDVAWQAAGSTLTLAGQVDASGEVPQLALSLTGVAVMRVLSAFVPTVAVDGMADVDVKVGGTFGDPDLSGGMTLRDVEVVVPSPRLVVSDLSGPIVLMGDRVELRGLAGSANDGTLTIDGGVMLDGASLSGGEIYIQASGLAVEYPEGLRSQIDALLTYDLSTDQPVLRGDVRVLRAAYTDPISLAALASASAGTTVRAATDASALEQLRLNIDVSTVTDLRVDNNYGRFDASAQLRIVGTAAAPGMSGRVTLREGGTIYAAGRTFTLTRGTVSFTNLSRIEPDLDIQAVTRTGGQGEVTLTLQGTPDDFSFDLSSEEGGSQEEIATDLFGGSVSGANAVALLSGDLLGVAGREFGLDTLRIDRGDVVRDEFREDPSAIGQENADPVTRLTLSKRLRDNVEFTISQNLAESGRTTFVVSYYPIRNLEIRVIQRDDASTGLGLRHQVTLGGASVSRRPEELPVVRVTSVRFEGDLSPLGEPELRNQIRLSAGNRFDYYTWQRDLQQLTNAYVSRGRYEARVRGRRDESGGEVTLVYEVNPGPATRVVVEGIQLPDSTEDAIREEWRQAVFDRFVVEEAQTLVRRHLIASGFVDGTVEAAMEEGAGTKTLRVQVEPGPPAGGHRIRFVGNRGIGQGQLEAVVAQNDLTIRGWIEPSALVRAIRDLYRREGYFNASVRVDAPEREGGDVMLPVVIAEGERATVSAVELNGVADERTDVMQNAADLRPETPYRLADVDAARTRVEQQYRTLGFNSVRVTSSATPDESGGAVAVSLTVEEGPQQILSEVVTSGATRTREGAVDRALRLPVGQPVNLQEWSLARKRLFDTNVFRTVDIQPVPLGEPVDGVQQVQARVTVEEYPPWRLRYGFQVDRERDEIADEQRINYSPGVIGELRNQNLLGRAFTGGVATRIERDYQRLNTFLQTPSFFGLPVRSGLFLFGSQENLRTDGNVFAVTKSTGISFEQRWRRWAGFEVIYGYTYERNHTYEPDPDPIDPFPIDQVANIGRVTSGVLFDRRDDPIDPKGGTFTSVTIEQAARWLAADAPYGRVLGQQHYFVSIGPLVLASRAIVGDAYGSGLTIQKRFFTGGGTTVRGYAQNGLGPRDPVFGEPAGGTELLVLNQEVRFPLYRWLRGVGFVDAGNVFEGGSPFQWGELKVGYGLGLRFNSPVGLLRVDLGLPASDLPGSIFAPPPSRRARWYFGLGQAF